MRIVLRIRIPIPRDRQPSHFDGRQEDTIPPRSRISGGDRAGTFECHQSECGLDPAGMMSNLSYYEWDWGSGQAAARLTFQMGCTLALVGSIRDRESSIGERGHSVVECGPGRFWRTDSRQEGSQPMDGATATLKEKLDHLLREAAEVSVALDRADGTLVGISHYAVIEVRARIEATTQSPDPDTADGRDCLASRRHRQVPECGTRCQLDRKGEVGVRPGFWFFP